LFFKGEGAMFFKREGFNQTRFRKDIVGIDKKVPLAGGKYRTYVNLDNAASTPVLRPVLDKVNEFMDWYSSVHRGSGFKSQVSTHIYDAAHELVGRFVKADLSSNCVIFVKNTTEAINKLSYRLRLDKGDIVLTTTMEHHSNDLPWRSTAETVYAGVDQRGALDFDDLEYKLKQYRHRIKLVSISGASNVTGFKNDIGRIAAMAHRSGIPVLVDGAQLVPHSPVNMGDVGHLEHIDFLVFSAHKMYAPFGTGVLIGPRKIFERGAPEYPGGGTISIVTHDRVEWAGLPDKEEAGSPNVVGAVALAAAIEYLKKNGMENIERYEKQLTEYTLKRLKEIGGITIYGQDDPSKLDNRVGVITFNINNIPHALVAAALSWEGGVAVRNGCFCAHPYMLKLLKLTPVEIRRVHNRIRAGDRSDIPGMVRISLAAYNNKQDIDRAIEALKKIRHMSLTGELNDRYSLCRSTGCFMPKDFKPDIERYFSLS
jgi:cysteine desulfurase/selenocysteine lyase